MNRLFATLLLSICVGSTLGCAMCNRCGDEDYSFQGGTHPRARLASGRVGSAFDDAEGVATGGDEYYDDAYSEEGQMLDGEVIEEGESMPAEEIFPEPMNELRGEPTPAEEPPATEASPDLPPGTQQTRTSAPKARRKTVSQDTYLP